MIPKLHPKGSSFRGAATYLLHDKGASTAERVAWTETLNLATDDPHVAWRVMAATALDASRLKQQAGIKATGRKSHDHVLHLTLSWHPDESAGVDREEMRRAALGALRALKAEDRQVMLVAHTDEPQAHVHLLINRVSPHDGRVLPSSYEKQGLSRWAEAYERERGQIYCENRVLNNAARDRGEFVRGQGSKPRHIHELESDVANDNRPDFRQVAQEQRRKDTALSRRQRDQRSRHRREWRQLEQDNKTRRKEIRDQARLEIAAGRSAVRREFRQLWQERLHERQSAAAVFEKNEQRLVGRIANAWAATDLKRILAGEDRLKTLSDVFNLWSQEGARRAHLDEQQRTRDEALAARQLAREREVERLRGFERDKQLASLRKSVVRQREQLAERQQNEEQQLRKAWSERRQERQAAFDQVRTRVNDPRKAPEQDRTDPSGRQTLTPTKAHEQAIKSHDERMKARAAQRRREQERGDRTR